MITEYGCRKCGYVSRWVVENMRQSEYKRFWHSDYYGEGKFVSSLKGIIDSKIVKQYANYKYFEYYEYERKKLVCPACRTEATIDIPTHIYIFYKDLPSLDKYSDERLHENSRKIAVYDNYEVWMCPLTK